MLAFSEIVRDLFSEKVRIILTILAIAWGTFAIASMLAIGEGLRINFAKTMANSGGNLLEITGGTTASDYRGMHANSPIYLTKQDLADIARLPNIASVNPQYTFSANLQYKNKPVTASVRAVTPEYGVLEQIQVGEKQRFISPSDMERRASVIVLGPDTADTLFSGDPEVVGRKVLIGERPFLVIGVMQKKSQIMMRHDTPDSSMNWIPTATYQLLTNPTKIDTIVAGYKSSQLLEQTEQQIKHIVAANHGANPNDDGVVNFSEFAKSQQEINNFFTGMQIFLGIVGGLTLLIAGIGIANVMFASVKRATHEIGVRMAIGANPRQILTHYVAESLVATFIGGIIGIVLAMFFVFVVKLIPMQGKFIDAIGKPEPQLSFLVLLIVVLVLGVIGLLAGLFPAMKAASIDPAEALTYE